jgi:hypothetical protein
MSEYLYEIFGIFLAYSKNMNEFILDGVVWPFLTYEIVHHIRGIFQTSERVCPRSFYSIYPNKHQAMSDPVPFHPRQVSYILQNTT